MIHLSRFVATLSVAALLASPLSAFAQSAPGAAAAAPAGVTHKHHHRSAYMHALRGLNLSEAQKQQIRSLMTSARASQKAAASTDPANRRVNAQKLRRQIDAVLTPDQRTQLRTAMQAARANRAPKA